MVDERGQYEFDPKYLRRCHQLCKEKVTDEMIKETNLIILDNTNTQEWEYIPYLNLAIIYGYESEIIMVGNLIDIDLYHSRNVHGVPLETLKRMAERFEI